jgi:hypothetical protein
MGDSHGMPGHGFDASVRGAAIWGARYQYRKGALVIRYRPTWSTYTLDSETGELFVTVSNPAPALDAKVRMGDNLYCDSVLDLDAPPASSSGHP